MHLQRKQGIVASALCRYEASLRSGSLLGRCWEWLESATTDTPTGSHDPSQEVRSLLAGLFTTGCSSSISTCRYGAHY